MKRILAETKGSVLVEAAVTLPLVLLLTVGGISVLLWLHHKTWLQVLVSETARERAADATWTGYYKDIRDSLTRPDPGLILAEARLFSFHLPADPPLVVAGACAAPAGVVPRPPVHAPPDADPAPPEKGGWLGPVRALRRHLSQWLNGLERQAGQAEAHLDAAVALGEQAVWYRRVADNLAGGDPYLARQAAYALAGAAVEELLPLPCRQEGAGEAVLAARAVMQGERTFGQR